MAENVGVAPPDYTTPVGQMRATLGDTSFTGLTPPVAGKGVYQYFSDEELEAYLVIGGDSLESALALAYNSLATSAAIDAKNVQDFDLKISTEKRATELRLLAQQWQAKADAIAADFFEVFDIGGSKEPCTPELAAYAIYYARYRGC